MNHKKLGYCLETARREIVSVTVDVSSIVSKIIDVEVTT